MTQSGDRNGPRTWPDLVERISRRVPARSALTLRARLRLLVVLVVASVGGGEAYLGVRLAERVMEQDLVDLALLSDGERDVDIHLLSPGKYGRFQNQVGGEVRGERAQFDF